MWAGVPIFFVISGYCISATADSARRKGLPARTYFWRRFRRIFPPYWIFLMAAVTVGQEGERLTETELIVTRQTLEDLRFSIGKEVQAVPENTLRIGGLIAIAVGVGIVWLLRG